MNIPVTGVVPLQLKCPMYPNKFWCFIKVDQTVTSFSSMNYIYIHIHPLELPLVSNRAYIVFCRFVPRSSCKVEPLARPVFIKCGACHYPTRHLPTSKFNPSAHLRRGEQVTFLVLWAWRWMTIPSNLCPIRIYAIFLHLM